MVGIEVSEAALFQRIPEPVRLYREAATRSFAHPVPAGERAIKKLLAWVDQEEEEIKRIKKQSGVSP